MLLAIALPKMVSVFVNAGEKARVTMRFGSFKENMIAFHPMVLPPTDTVT